MFDRRNVLRLLPSKNDFLKYSCSKSYNGDSSIAIKRILKNVDLPHFLRCNQSAFKNGERQIELRDDRQIPNERLADLIIDENNNYIDASFIFQVDPTTEDKVNDVIRDAEIEKLCDLNTVYFELPMYILSATVSLVDRFISRVKVKPKYMPCLTAACLQLAATNCGYNKVFLSLDNLANLFHCGASGQDLEHMQNIVKKKLSTVDPMVTTYDFIERIDPEAAKDHHLNRILEAALMKFIICWHRPSRVAMAVLIIYYQKMRRYHLIERLYEMFKNDWDQIKYLSIRLAEQYSSNLQSHSSELCRERLLWIISRRTLNNIRISVCPELETIAEEKEVHCSVP